MTDYSDRKGDWIITYTGKRFYVLDPRPEDIDIEDIAHSLSLLNRFTGHSRHPYSVAQHCIQVACALFADGYQEPDYQRLALSGLLHDASEAYVNDLARPLKINLPEYKIIENKILDVIDAKFNVDTRSPLVKDADNRALVTEASQLCKGETWYLDDSYPLPYGYVCSEVSWRKTKDRYLTYFYAFGGKDDNVV